MRIVPLFRVQIIGLEPMYGTIRSTTGQLPDARMRTRRERILALKKFTLDEYPLKRILALRHGYQLIGGCGWHSQP